MAEAAQQITPQTLGAMIDELKAIDLQRKALANQDKVLADQYKLLEAQVMRRLDEEETTMSRGKRASATITETTVAQVKDWDSFYEFVTENDALFLLQRRVANAAYRDLIDAGETVPGVVPFIKRALSVRAL